MKQMKKLALCAGLIISMLLSGCSYIFPVEEEPIKPPMVDPTNIKYTTTSVMRGTIEKCVNSSANVIADQTYTLFFKTHGGYVTKLNNAVSTQVKKGDILVQLDVASLEKELAAAQIELKRASIDLASLLQQQDKIVENIDNVEDENAAIKLKKAEKDLEAFEEWIKNGKYITNYNDSELEKKHQYTFEEWRKNSEFAGKDEEIVLEEKQLAVTKALHDYVELLTKKNPKEFEIQSADLNVKVKEMEIKRIQEDIENSTLRSPIDGQITETADLRVGKNVNINQELLTIVDTSKLSIVTGDVAGIENLSELERPKAIFEINGKKYTAKLIRNVQMDVNGDVSPKQNVDKTYIIQMDNMPDNFFSSNKEKSKTKTSFQHGDSIPFKVILAKKENVLYVPNAAVKIIEDGKSNEGTISVLENGIKIDKSITVGLRGDAFIEVTNGLTEGEEVVIR